MANTYNDEAKEASREKLREFIRRNLMNFKKPRDIKVVCFPGAEIDGEEALEVRRIYDPLGIPRENIVGIEANPARAERLRNAGLGITVEQKKDLDFFQVTPGKFDVISLDYTGYRDENKWKALHQIAGRQLLYGNGILCTNYSARRESRKYQGQMLTLQFDRISAAGNKEEEEDELEKMIAEYECGKDLDLTKLRNGLTHRTLSIMRMGTSALSEIKLLTTYPYYDQVQKELEEVEKTAKEESPGSIGFMLEHRYESGMGDCGPSHPLSYLYRDTHMKMLAKYMSIVNRISLNLAGFLMNCMTDLEIRAQFPRAIERYCYVSNKNATMEMDLVAFVSADRVYKKLKDNIFYDEMNGKLRVTDISGRGLIRIAEQVNEQKEIKVPERAYLGSSWNPSKRNERISKEDAVDLLVSGVSPKEISQCYSGFSKGQLAALKAHYVTMGKKL